MPGKNQINKMDSRLKDAVASDPNVEEGKVETVIIHGDLPLHEQAARSETVNHKGFVVFLVTNIAETSLTLPRVRYVVDSGRARKGRWNYRLQMFVLDIYPISAAAARQRAGRAGRTGPGFSMHMASEYST